MAIIAKRAKYHHPEQRNRLAEIPLVVSQNINAFLGISEVKNLEEAEELLLIQTIL